MFNLFKEKKSKEISLKLLFIIVIAIWVISGLLTWFYFKNWSNSGSFGDTFGAINSLFSGLALAGIIYTVYLQKNELKLQRKELKYTREELKRTANAQESTAKMMTEQIRINSIPFLQYNSKTINGVNYVQILNESENPAFDIDICLFFTQLNFDNSLKDFVKDHVANEYRKQININELVDGDIWSISERGVYGSFPRNKKIIIPFDYPFEESVCHLFIQYRDCLNNNYSQKIVFMINNESLDKPYDDSVYDPHVPTVTKRVDLFDKVLIKDDIPEVAKEAFELNKTSIFVAYLKQNDFIGVDNRWKIEDI